jgi:antitoxin YefM
MEKILPISDLATKTKEIVEGVKKTGDPVIITQRGRPAALLVNYEEYEGMLHTLDEMSYPDWKERLEEAEEDSRKGRGITLEDLEKKIAKQREQKRAHRKVSSKG